MKNEDIFEELFLEDFIVARILDQLGIDNDLTVRWTGEEVE